MQSQLEIEQIITRTRQYEFSDGLRDMQLALMWISYGVMIWVSFDLAPIWFPVVIGLIVQYGRWAGVSTAVVMLVPSLLILAAWGVITIVRRRWLWRKTGTVKSPRIVVPRRVNVISMLILLVGLGILFGLMQLGLVDGVFAIKGLFGMSGVCFGYTMIAMGKYLQLPRYTLVGWVGGLLSLPALAAPLTIGQFSLIVDGMWGVVLIASGISPLINTMRAVRAARVEPGDADDRRD